METNQLINGVRMYLIWITLPKHMVCKKSRRGWDFTSLTHAISVIRSFTLYLAARTASKKSLDDHFISASVLIHISDINILPSCPTLFNNLIFMDQKCDRTVLVMEPSVSLCAARVSMRDWCAVAWVAYQRPVEIYHSKYEWSHRRVEI